MTDVQILFYQENVLQIHLLDEKPDKLVIYFSPTFAFHTLSLPSLKFLWLVCVQTLVLVLLVLVHLMYNNRFKSDTGTAKYM